LVKQRNDSLDIFRQQNRNDLAQKEEEEIRVIEQFLPKQLSEEEIRAELEVLLKETGASSPADLGKVMGLASRKMAGRADGKIINAIAKDLLSR